MPKGYLHCYAFLFIYVVMQFVFVYSSFAQTASNIDLTIVNQDGPVRSTDLARLEYISADSKHLFGFPNLSILQDTSLLKEDSVGFWKKFGVLISELFKHSGPGPFIGGGVEYRSADRTGNNILALSGTFFFSIQNDLTYDSTITGYDTTTPTPYAIKAPFNKSKKVYVVSLRPSALYKFPHSEFELGLSVGLNYYLGEAFSPFFKPSLGPYTAVSFSNLRLGAIGNLFFEEFKPQDFGAHYTPSRRDFELVWQFFIELNF